MLRPTTTSRRGKVQVSRNFLDGVWLLLDSLKEYRLDAFSSLVCELLQREADEKLAAIERREVFTRYKTTPVNSCERETLRKDYLDLSGIHNDWRSPKEFFPSP